MSRSALKLLDLPIYFMTFWWLFWLAMAYTDFMGFIPPSYEVLFQYLLFITFFIVGHYFIKFSNIKYKHRGDSREAHRGISGSMRLVLRTAALTCSILLVLSLYLSGAFTLGFFEYYSMLRMSGDSPVSLTNVHALDVLTKILAFPLSYSVILVILANGVNHFKSTFFLCVFNILAFAYLWQVNYSIVHFFWFLFFQFIIQTIRNGALNKRNLVALLILSLALIAVAINRYGGDIFGAIQRYILGYHLIGFSFYDQHYQDPNCLLHAHTFGRSSLGFLDQMLEALLKRFDIDYQAASFENSDHNHSALDIGLLEIKEFNAFGTFLFGFYRDFGVLGILTGGFFYGAISTFALYRSENSWFWHAMFLFFASTWMVGMLVNPIEQAYFWFALLSLGIFNLASRVSSSRIKSFKKLSKE